MCIMKHSSFAFFRPVLYALLAALLFGLNAPLSKLLVARLDPLFLAALLYLGAGAGMWVLGRLLHHHQGGLQREAALGRKDFPYVLLMILLDIAAPILLLMGLKQSNASTTALLGNFELAATALFAALLFGEAVGQRLWLSIALITAGSLLLSLGDAMTARFSTGALLVVGACLCWGLENNTTRRLSLHDPLQIVVIKGFGSGLGALLITAIWGSFGARFFTILAGLVLGFAAYGLSIYFYVKAQRELGAARTSAYYAAAPFMGSALAWLMLHEPLSINFWSALALMLPGVWLAVSERHSHVHFHPALDHNHRHSHDDGHHDHLYEGEVSIGHSHIHHHEPLEHSHPHFPDSHHRHDHDKEG